MVKKKKEKAKEEKTVNSPEIQLDDVVMSRSQISVDKSTHTTKNVTIFHQDSTKEPSTTKYSCHSCDREFDSKRSWRQHYNAKHREDEEDLDDTTPEDSLIPENSESQFPNCLKCGDAEDVDFYEDGLACYYCKHVINEDGECISGSYCSKCNPEEGYEEPTRRAPQGVLFSLSFGLLFAIIYVFFFGEVYNLLTSQISYWAYWAGITFPCITGFAILFILYSVKSGETDELGLVVLLPIVAPFLIALVSIVGNLYGTFWMILAVLIFIFLLPDDSGQQGWGGFLILSIILIAIAQFFIVFEDAFKGFALSYVDSWDSLVPAVIKYELVYFLMSFSLGFGLSLLFGYLSEGTHHLEIEEHYLVHGTITGFLFFLTEFFIYPLSDNIFVAIIFFFSFIRNY